VYEYKAEVTRVVDGDTLDLRIDLGFAVGVDVRARLDGIDTPEVYGVKHGSEEHIAGTAASEFAKAWLAERTVVSMAGNPRIVVRTKKGTGKYGRWIAEVLDASGEGQSLNQALVESGNAVWKDY
jgi:micrococcal nuclease